MKVGAHSTQRPIPIHGGGEGVLLKVVIHMRSPVLVPEDGCVVPRDTSIQNKERKKIKLKKIVTLSKRNCSKQEPA